MCATSWGHTDIAATLIDGKADLNIVDQYGKTALIHAAVRGYTMTARALVDAKADLKYCR